MGRLSNPTWNPKHPINAMHNFGQHVKSHVRKMSNAELDDFLRQHVDESDIEKALSFSRSKKIKMIKDNAMRGFMEDYKAKVEAEKKKKEEKEDAKA